MQYTCRIFPVYLKYFASAGPLGICRMGAGEGVMAHGS